MAVFGIDFGTAYARIAKLDDDGNPRVIYNMEDGSDKLACAVYFINENCVKVGQSAIEMGEKDGSRLVEFVRRYIGTDTIWEFDENVYTPVEISAMILTQLKEMAEEQGEEVKDIVLALPCYYGLGEKQALWRTVKLAGMNLLCILPEPTAAALFYCAGIPFQEERTILVYDLGGGTFNVTIMKMSMEQNEAGKDIQKVTAVAASGNDRLGGKDWDNILYSMIESVCCEENGLTPDDLEPETVRQICRNVEKTKKKLSNLESVKVKIVVNGAITNVVVTREEFEQQTAGKVAETIYFVDDVMQKAGNPALDMVLLVGGSTYMPMISQAVEERFEGVRVNCYDPSLAVAEGAAMYAGMCGFE